MIHNKKNIIWPDEFKSGQTTWQSNQYGDCYQDDEYVYMLYFEKRRPKFRQIKDETERTIRSEKIQDGYWDVGTKPIKKELINEYYKCRFVQGQRKCKRTLRYEDRLKLIESHFNGKFVEIVRFLNKYIVKLSGIVDYDTTSIELRFLIDEHS